LNDLSRRARFGEPSFQENGYQQSRLRAQSSDSLSKVDPILARIIAQVGALGIQPRRERFQALARAIIFQQLAGAAANAIYGRFVLCFPRWNFPRRNKCWQVRR